jgi:hypothetical protein
MQKQRGSSASISEGIVSVANTQLPPARQSIDNQHGNGKLALVIKL